MLGQTCFAIKGVTSAGHKTEKSTQGPFCTFLQSQTNFAEIRSPRQPRPDIVADHEANIFAFLQKQGEAAKPELSGEDPYDDQAPLSRVLPVWGAISPKGYCSIVCHKTKKLNAEEWLTALKAGKLRKTTQQLEP